MVRAAPEPEWWRHNEPDVMPSGIVVLSANYNTRELIARMLWSLHRFLGTELHTIVVVDNGSTDGSVDLLNGCAGAGVCELVALPQNIQHGPGITAGLSWLARQYRDTSIPRPWIWILDSDCMVARQDTSDHLLAAACDTGAALIGEPYWNSWHKENRFGGYSVLIDPARVWRPEIGTFQDLGDPIGEFERSCLAAGVVTGSFPFTQEGYLIHRGRGALAGVYERREEAHPLFEWARDHHQPHFQRIEGAEVRLDELMQIYTNEIPELTAETLIRACQKAGIYDRTE